MADDTGSGPVSCLREMKQHVPTRGNIFNDGTDSTRTREQYTYKCHACCDEDDKHSNGKRRRHSDEPTGAEDGVPDTQSNWGSRLPEDLLIHILSLVCHEVGCIPFLVSASKVCRLWNHVASIQSLWHSVDLSGGHVKAGYKTENHLKWLCSNRLSHVRELDIGDWKIVNVADVLETLCKNCPRLQSLSLSGWKGLSTANLAYAVNNLPRLSQIDLSRMTSDSKIVSAQSLTSIFQIMNQRLTHLVLAYSRVRGLSQIIIALSTYCPNLELLDISYLDMYCTAIINLEKFQHGCQKLKVLRITNSSVALCSTPLKKQVLSPGFPALEELSAAGFSLLDNACSKPYIDDSCMERILKTSARLKLIDIRGHPGVSDLCLVRIPAGSVERLFLAGCGISKGSESGLELIMQKWNHSLVEVDLSWVTIKEPLDSGVIALAECGEKSHLQTLNLCGSSVSFHAVKAVVLQCPQLYSLNLASCRALSRGMKRLYTGSEISELRCMFESSKTCGL